MTADSYSTSLQLRLQATGNNSATWGTIANSDFSLIEAAITGDNGLAGNYSTGGIDVAGLTTYSLTWPQGTAGQAQNMLWPFTGALTGDCTVTVPAVVKIGWAANFTTGGFNVILTTGSGTTLTLPPMPGWTLFYCDGTNVGAAPLSTALKAIYVGYVAQGGTLGIAAAGTTLGAGTLLTGAYNVVTTATIDVNDAVTLSNNVPIGASLTVTNASFAPLQLFPGDGSSSLNGLPNGASSMIEGVSGGNAPPTATVRRLSATTWSVNGGWPTVSNAGYGAAGSSISDATITNAQISIITVASAGQGVKPDNLTPLGVVLTYLNFSAVPVNLYPGDGSSVINLLSAGTPVLIGTVNAGYPGRTYLLRNTATQWYAWVG